MHILGPKIENSEVGKHYLVISPQGFGDSLEATPMLEALRHAAPNAKIDVAVLQRPAKALFDGLVGLVDEVLYLPLWESGRFSFIKKLFSVRRGRHYDATFLTYPAARWEYQILSWMIPSRRRYAHQYEPVTINNLLWLNTDLCPINKRHNVLRNLDLLQMAGMEPEIPRGYTIPASWKAEPTDFESRRIVAHVGTVVHHGRESRRWPPEYFAAVLNRCAAEGMDVWLLMGPNEIEVTHEVESRVPGIKIFSGGLSEVGKFLSSAAIVLTNDNGIGHLAAGTGAQVVALFGPTPLEHAPFGENVLALRPTSCEPCFDVRKLHASCALNINYKCLRQDLTPEFVFRNIQSVLAKGDKRQATAEKTVYRPN